MSRWPSNRRPETSRLLKVGQDMLHGRIKLRLGGCVLSRQDTDYTEGEGRQEFTAPGPRREVRPAWQRCVYWLA